MSTTSVFKLDDYRDRRRQRLRVARALYGGDPARAALVDHLDAIARVLGADRVATVWLDEYGPGLVHPHVVLDLLADHPRRAFPTETLRRAWERGVPGAFESFGPTPGLVRELSAPPWSMAVALGSDGTRAWFVVADAVAPRAPVDATVRDRLMFLAGECSGVVLHRDLDAAATGAAGQDERRAPARFAGWSILQDLEERDPDSEESRLISLRFIVGRLPRLLVEDDLSSPPDRRRQQAERAREEIEARRSGTAGPHPEERHWAAVLDAFAGGDLGDLAEAVVSWAEAVEGMGHQAGALELYHTGYEIAAAAGRAELAVEASRLSGRCLRRQSRWDDAHGQYRRAREVAEAAGMPDRVALVLDGVATIHRERGNLPAARTALAEGLEFATASGDDMAVARVHHGYMGLEHNAGNLDDAIHHGWTAVRIYSDDVNRTRGLAGLAGIFQDKGHLRAAEDAWTLVAHLSEEGYYQLYAADALSHIAALRGDAAGFARRAAEVDAMGWERGDASVKAEILLYRGLSFRALGLHETAREWLERAVGYAERNGFGQVLFRAEEVLRNLQSGAPPPEPPAPVLSDRTQGVVRELSQMRRERVGAPA